MRKKKMDMKKTIHIGRALAILKTSATHRARVACHVKWVFSLIAAIVLGAACMAQGQALPDNESLQYDIIYQWGLLWVKAADGTLSISRDGDLYHAQVTASTTPFADGIMKVRDTLTTTMQSPHLMPLRYKQISREGKYYQVNEIDFVYRNDSTVGNTHIYRPTGHLDDKFSLGRQGDVFDMISIFYRIRNHSFDTMQVGEVIKTYIFSGRQIETLELEYQGIKSIKLDDKEYPAHYIRFFFYNDDGSKKSDKISAWISTDDFVPLQLEGKLPIGSMKVRLSGRN